VIGIQSGDTAGNATNTSFRLDDAFWAGVNDIGGLVPTTEGKVLATLVSLAVLFLAVVASRRLQPHLEGRVHPALADFGTTALFVSALLTVGTLVAGIWGQAELIERLLQTRVLSQDFAPNAVVSLILVVLTQVVVKFVRRVLDRLQKTSQAVSKHQREIFYRTSQVTLYIALFFVILGVWDFNVQGLLVGAGFLGIVVGMAARQTLGAVIAGFVLMFSRPFEIGDWVEIGDAEGIVKDITIVNTRLETFDGESVVLPNDNVSSTNVINRTRKGRLRLEVDVGVDYESDVERASEVAIDAMDDCEAVLSVPTPQVVGKEFADSAIVLGCRFWIDKPSARRMWRARTAVISAIQDAFREEGVKIPFPQRELSGREETGGLELAEGSVIAEADDGSEPQTEPTPDGGRSSGEEE